MESEDDGCEVERSEAVEKIHDGVVVGGYEGVGDRYGVMPGFVPCCQLTAARVVKDI